MRHEPSSVFEGSSTDTPRPFIEIPRLWLKVHKMSEAFLAGELPRASGTNVLLSVLILAGILTVYHLMGFWKINDATQDVDDRIAAFLTLHHLMGPWTIKGEIKMDTTLILALSSSWLRGAAGSIRVILGVASVLFGCPSTIASHPLSSLLGTLVGYYASTWITFSGAQLVGGTGTYRGQTYLQSLFFVPLTVVCALLTPIPYAGPVISLALSLYVFILHVRAVKVSHRLSTGQAIGAMVILLLFVAPVDFVVTLAIGGAAQIHIIPGTR